VTLPGSTWIRLAIWFFLGLVIYALYGARHSVTPTWALKNPPEK
jgi:hypothetical protein